MKKLTRIVAVVIALVVVLCVALVILAKVLITPERVRQTILPLAEEQLERKLELGEISVSLFSGIELHGLKIYERDGTEVFISSDLVRLKYQLLPLLAMKVVVDEVRLDQPQIRVVRYGDGRFNYSDLLGAESTKSAQPSSSTSTRSDSSPISLLVSRVLLQGGRVVFFDHTLNDKTPYRFEVADLQLRADGVSLTGKVPLRVECLVNDSRLVLEGSVSLLPLGFDLKLNLQPLDLVPFTPYFKEALPGRLGGLKLSTETTLSGTVDDLRLTGSLLVADLDLTLDALADAPINGARVAVGYDVALKEQDALKISTLTLDYNGIKAETSGEVTKLSSKPSLQLAVVVPKLPLRDALDASPRGLIDLGELDPAGTVDLKVSLAGPVDQPGRLLRSAEITLDNVQASAAGYRPALSGQLSLSGDRLESTGLQLRLGDNTADLKLVASQLFAPVKVVNLDVSSERFQLDPLLKGGGASAAATDVDTARAAVAETEEPGPFDLPLVASGGLRIARAEWHGLSVDDFKARYQLKDNVFTLSALEGLLAGGSFDNSARVDLARKGLAYSGKIAIKGVQADPLITALVPKATGSLLGTLNLDLDISGRGTQWQTLRDRLSGKGSMLIADGRLISPGLVNGLAAVLQLPELNDIPFSNFDGNFTIDQGKLKLDSRIVGDDIRLLPKGDVGLNGSLNLALDTRLSPQLSSRLDRKGEITGYLVDKDGWTRVPLLLKGRFDKPSFGLDPKGLSEQATQALGNELGRRLNKLLGGSEKPADGTTQQPQEGTSAPAENPAKKLLQDSLKGLFGN
jgi:AsmA protein